MPEDTGSNDRASTWDIVSLDEAVETDDPSRREGGTHLKYGMRIRLLYMEADICRLQVGLVYHLLPNLLRRAVRRATLSMPMRGQLRGVSSSLRAV